MDTDEFTFSRAEELYGKGDFKSSFSLYLALANSGRVGCQRFVGWMYFSGEGVDQDLSKAYAWFQKAAQAGDREAMFGAGRVCLLTNEDANAMDWFSRACQRDFAPGCFRLGWMYLQGRGSQKDRNKAYELFDHAYAAGHLPAGRARALLLISGQQGVFGRLRGLCLFVKVFVQIVAAAIHDPKSQRFMK